MSYDLRVNIRFSVAFDQFTVELIAPDGRTARENADASLWQRISIPRPIMMIDTGVILASSIWRGAVADLLADVVTRKPGGELGRILFEPGELVPQAIPWEAIMLAPPLQGSYFVFVRWSETAAPLAGTAPQLPISCLTAAVGAQRPYNVLDVLRNLLPDPDVNLPRTFQITEGAAGHEELRAIVARHAPDIVHLLLGPTDTFDPQDFLALLTEYRIRLFILHISWPGEASHKAEAYTRQAHSAAHRGSPAIVITSGPDAVTDYFYLRFYEQLVHDEPFDVAFFRAQQDTQNLSHQFITRLFLGRGAENLLRLSSVAERLRADAEDSILNIQASLADRTVNQQRAADAISMFRTVIDAAQAFAWNRESLGLVPLAAANSALNNAQLLHREAEKIGFRIKLQPIWGVEELPLPERPVYQPEPGEPRVVNVSFLGPEGIVSPSRALTPATRYNLRVQVGRRLPESIVRNPALVPETELLRFMRPAGLLLRVVLSSRQFELLDRELELILPPEGPTEMLQFRARTPAAEGLSQLRVSIYYENNLLQSIRVSATVAQPAGLEGPGNSAEVEYCVCGTMREVEMYQPRSLSLLLNESHDGTHTFAILGTDIREHFTFTEGEMSASLLDARRTLLGICAELDKNGRPARYRYDSKTNQGTPGQFVADLKKLACAGRDLYTVFVTNRNQAFAKRLRDVLAQTSGIQIASTRSAKYVFPWALVYDKLLIEDDSNEICGQFLSDVAKLNSGAFRCLSSRCPNINDPNVICPSGFWGYRHVIEQPPSIAEEEMTPGRDLPMHLDLDGDPTIMMGISLDLDFSDEHYRQLSGVRPYQITLARDKRSIVKGLLDQPAPNLVYFYCHGGKDNGKAFLGIGKSQRLLTGDLVGCGLSWPDTHPLVFINGCGTVEISPDDLLTFVTTFAWCQAAGVVGAEISIPEDLAREFALNFFQTILEPDVSVGEAIRRERLSLLAKYNLLGLAYTPFCHSSLQFHVSS